MTPGLAEDPAGPERTGDEQSPVGEQIPDGDAVAPESPEAEQPEGAVTNGTDPADEEAATGDPLVEMTRERDEYLDLAQRTRAEFDNYRKRVATESEQAVIRGRTEVANGVIGTLDNLERAMETEGVTPGEALAGGLPEGSPVTLQGLVVAYRDLVGALASAGIEQFDPAGEEFDPNLHEALQALEADGTTSGIVLEVMQRGYRAGDQVIRAARVVVSK